jgi:putative ABC transport system permease protein
VVGVVGDIKHASLEAELRPEIYRPFLHNRDTERQMTFAVRTAQKPETLVAAIRQEIQALDREQPIANSSTMEQLLDRSLARRRFSLLLLGIFAATALILTGVGIYGVISYAVAQNTREIGIRMALGAQASDVLKLILGQGLALTVAGVVIGLAGAFGLTRLMASLLYDITPTDLPTFAGVATLLVLVATLACYVPARRAMKVDPMRALRHE